MPTTIPVPALPEWANPEQASVFDPLHETLIKRAVGTLGLEDPNTAIQSLMGPMGVPAGLISRVPLNRVPFLNKRVLEMAKNAGLDQSVIDAIEFATKKYPRTLAHVGAIKKAEGGFFKPMGYAEPAIPEGISTISIKPESWMPFNMNRRDVAKTFGHELTHAGQILRKGRKFSPQYRAAEEALGYRGNPYEQGAEKAGVNFAKKMMASDPPQESVISRLMSLFGK